LDSVTQFALGATVGVVALGPRIGPRKAAIIGGLMGTVPDLDTFVPSADQVEKFVSHRGATHSLVIQALATPLFAEPLVRLFKDLRDSRIRTYLAVYLMFATHALIDALTVYGTKLLWPLTDYPFGVGSIFIIDPVYTLPLLFVTLAALFMGTWRTRFGRWARGALGVTTAYMLATIPMQSAVTARAETVLSQNGITPERLIAIPTPFNTVYWQAIAITPTQQISLYMPIYGDEANVTAYTYPRRPDLRACLAGLPKYQDLEAFTKGYFRLYEQDDRVIFADLRMGLAPSYVFRFALAEKTGGTLKGIEAPDRLPTIREAEGDLPWLFAGIQGEQIVRPAEAEAEIALGTLMPSLELAATGPCGTSDS
jgi:inner membrane protein